MLLKQLYLNVIVVITTMLAVIACNALPLANPESARPTEVKYSAEKISLAPMELNVDNLSTQSANQQILFNNWSNSGQKFTFIVPLSKELIDPNPPQGKNNTYRAVELWVVNKDGTDARKIADQMGYSALWSPDDTKIVYFKVIGINKRELWVIDLTTNSHVKLNPPSGLDINNTDYYANIAWLDNHRLLYPTYSKTSNRHVWLHNMQTGQINEVIIDDKLGNTWRDLNLAENKTSIVGRTEDDTLWLGRLSEENGQIRLDYHKTLITGDTVIAYWSPDSVNLAIQSDGQLANILRVIDLNADKTVEISFPLAVAWIGWSPDSRMLIVVTRPSGTSPTTPVYVVNADGSNLRLLLDDFPIGSTQWSPDGQYLVFRSVDETSGLTFDTFKVEVKP